MFFVGGIIFAKPQMDEPEYDNCGTPKEIGLMDSKDNAKIGWNKADECVLMQYTGLKDRNGVKIFEGDVLKTISEIIRIKRREKTGRFSERLSVVKWNKDRCHFSHDNYLSMSKDIIKEYSEVIGNIYQNPELLNEENNQ